MTTVFIVGFAVASNGPLGQDILSAWESFGISFEAVSQNHIGDAYILNWKGDRIKWLPEREKVERALMNHHIS